MMLAAKFVDARRGNTAIEYGLIAAGTAMAIMAAVAVLGSNLGTVLCQAAGGLGGTCPLTPAQQLAQLAANSCNRPGHFTMSADGQSCNITYSFLSPSTGWGTTTESGCATGGGTWDSTSSSCKTTSVTMQQCVYRGGTFDATTGTCGNWLGGSGNSSWEAVRTDPNTGESYTQNGCPPTYYSYNLPSDTQVYTDTNGNLHATMLGVTLPADHPKSTNTGNGLCSWQ